MNTATERKTISFLIETDSIPEGFGSKSQDLIDLVEGLFRPLEDSLHPFVMVLSTPESKEAFQKEEAERAKRRKELRRRPRAARENKTERLKRVQEKVNAA